MKYRVLTTKLHQQYLDKIQTVKNRLKRKIPPYPLGSFYGACRKDTSWSKSTVMNQETMKQIYAENRTGNDPKKQKAQIAFSINAGKIRFASNNSLLQYKANPEQKSVIRVTSTTNGHRIAATTNLTMQGLSMQETTGCMGCHNS